MRTVHSIDSFGFDILLTLPARDHNLPEETFPEDVSVDLRDKHTQMVIRPRVCGVKDVGRAEASART